MKPIIILKEFPFVIFDDVCKTCKIIHLSNVSIITKISKSIINSYVVANFNDFLQKWYKHFIDMIIEDKHKELNKFYKII